MLWNSPMLAQVEVEDRAQTALLLWNTAGRPESADAPAFADVADPDTAKAAQWCVEQGLMKRRLNGKLPRAAASRLLRC